MIMIVYIVTDALAVSCLWWSKEQGVELQAWPMTSENQVTQDIPFYYGYFTVLIWPLEFPCDCHGVEDAQ